MAGACWRLALLVAVFASLSGCGLAVDSEQLRVCRFVLPALHAETARVQEIEARPEGARGVRIDYLFGEAGEPTRRVFAICRFAGDALSPRRLDLDAIVTPAGPLGDVRLHILKRHWLEAFGVAAAAPPRRRRRPFRCRPLPPTRCSRQPTRWRWAASMRSSPPPMRSSTG